MSDQQSQSWPHILLAIIKEMAEQQTNPVLLILDGVQHIQKQQRYPEAGLEFGNGLWRVFYHCHSAPDSHTKEHGHFHLFTRMNDSWSHVVALSIDPYGQPLHWFCVNRWVTGGNWLSHCQLLQNLRSDTYSDTDPLVGRWLFAMLQLYHDSLLDLYNARDQYCQKLANEEPDEAFFENRDIYSLASMPIDIRSHLEASLTSASQSHSSCHEMAGASLSHRQL